MNEKFFDLKKEKQDRMINAGLRIFALNGYHHASTDEIVKEAKISKGLLFHYFGSKAGYYSFLYSYISRFVILELKGAIRLQNADSHIDFWDLQQQLAETEAYLMEQYPAVFLFFESVKMEDDMDGLSVLEELDVTVPELYDFLHERADLSSYPRIKDPKRLSETLHYVKTGLMRELLYDKTNPISLYSTRVQGYLDSLKNLTT